MQDKSGYLTLIDVNAYYGRTNRGMSDFPTVRSRLDFMDRLGISISVMWSSETRHNHPLSSNQRMLDDIAATPEAAGRIIPALTVSGLITYERDGIQTLKRQMIAGKTCALRFVRAMGHLTLCQLEPVIRGVADLKPFIVTTRETPDEDILAFAEMFPAVKIILTDTGWGGCLSVFDMMRLRRNILVCNSLHYSFGALEQTVEHFGAERLVFGTSVKPFGGASIAQIPRAGISEKERQMVMHGNLESLLGLKGKSRPYPLAANKPADSLWARCLAGRKLGVDMVDAHVHMGPSAGYVVKEWDINKNVNSALTVMDSLGINTAVVSSFPALFGDATAGNDQLEEVLSPHTDRFRGYVGFNPFYADELVARFKKYFSGKVYVGFKTLCGYWGVATNDPRFKPMWEYANRHRLPMLYHTWGKADVANLRNAARKYPHAHFLLAHSGGPDDGRSEAVLLAQECPNVYLEWCGSYAWETTWEDTLTKVNPGQVLFGTDAVAHDFNWELGRLLSLDVPDKTLIPILGRNMRRILASRR